MTLSRQRFLMAVDPSLTCSGWALFSCSDGVPLATGVISAPGTAEQLSFRLEVLQKQISELLEKLRMGRGDVLVCEGPAPLVLNPSSSVKVEQVRGLFEVIAREKEVQVPGRINPRSVHTELLGLSGKQPVRAVVKEAARSVVNNLYGESLQSLPVYGAKSPLRELPQDIVDALLIGVLAISKIQIAQNSQRPLAEAFSSKKNSKSLSRSKGRFRWSEDDLHLAKRVEK